MKARQKIGSILVGVNMITQEELDRCLEMQQETGQKLGEILLREGLVTKEQVSAILEFQYDVVFIDLAEFNIDPTAHNEIEERIARKHKIIPIGYKGETLVVAMADPMDFVAKDDLRLITGRDLEIVMAFESDVIEKIDKLYDRSWQDLEAVRDLSMDPGGGLELVPESFESEDVSNAPVVRLVNSIITSAIRKRASDIHLEPFENNVRARFRIDGDLIKEMDIPKASYVAIVTRVKIMGGMDISEKRAPQDGRVETEFGGKEVDLRISILPTVYGEKVVIRILERSNINMTKEQIGFSDENIKLFDEIMKAPEGIILLTGPTGSGKTTTLYAALQELNDEKRNIITAEDPVEYRLEGVNQVHINPKAGLTFATTLRSILRQDPDVIMVGEIRDGETAEIAIRAAITGHLVLSTLHTNDTVSTITRLIDMGIEPFLVSTSLIGVISQRLVKRICASCKKEVPMTEEDMKNLKITSLARIYKGQGCRQCNDSGYRGRIAVHEILAMDRAMKNSVAKGETVDKLREVAEKRGMISLADSSRKLVLEGVTTIEEMLRVAFSIED